MEDEHGETHMTNVGAILIFSWASQRFCTGVACDIEPCYALSGVQELAVDLCALALYDIVIFCGARSAELGFCTTSKCTCR